MLMKKMTNEEQARILAARRAARGGNVGDQLQVTIRGLHVFAARLDAAGDPELATELSTAAKKADQLLTESAKLTAEAQAMTDDHVGKAVAAVAAELVKKLPVCFQTAAEASAFAHTLPLTEARRSESLQQDKRNKASKKSSELRHEARRILETAAIKATDEVIDAAAAMKTVAAMGV